MRPWRVATASFEISLLGFAPLSCLHVWQSGWLTVCSTVAQRAHSVETNRAHVELNDFSLDVWDVPSGPPQYSLKEVIFNA
jgi:hypothetical protein